MESIGTDPLSFGVPMSAIEGLGKDASGPEVATCEIEALMETGSLTQPLFLDSEPTHVGRKRKAKDMSGLSVCVMPFYFLRLILSGTHYRLVLIFRVYLVLPAFAAYRTSVLT